ncbi:MAG: hypothetical protein AB7R69_03425 [Candidatus Babeliales bacterium]
MFKIAALFLLFCSITVKNSLANDLCPFIPASLETLEKIGTESVLNIKVYLDIRKKFSIERTLSEIHDNTIQKSDEE